MKIRHEGPHPDLHWQVRAALSLQLPDGTEISVPEWSLAGFPWPEDAPDCTETAVLGIPFQGVDIRFPVRLKKVPGSRDVEFDGLSGRQRETLALFYQSLLSGKMVSSGAVITALDTPVDLVPMGESEADEASRSATPAPRLLRALLSLSCYVLMAVFVLGVLGQQIFLRADRISFQHGRIVTEQLVQETQRAGYVRKLLVAEGDRVTAGQRLAELLDPEAEAAVRRARAEMQLAELELTDLEAALGGLLQHLPRFERETARPLAARAYARFPEIRGLRAVLQAWDPVETRAPLPSSADPLLEAVQLLQQAVAEQEIILRGHRQELTQRKNMARSGYISARADGEVVSVDVLEGQYLRAGSLAFTLRGETPLRAAGWASDRLAETVFAGMPATLGLNAGGRRQRLDGLVVEVMAADHPTRPGEFGLMVMVEAAAVPGLPAGALHEGLPVNLYGHRRILDRIIGVLFQPGTGG